MSRQLIYLTVMVALLFSCGSSQNFNQQKYTKLNKIKLEKTSEELEKNNVPVSYYDQNSKTPTIESNEQIIESDAKEQINTGNDKSESTPDKTFEITEEFNSEEETVLEGEIVNNVDFELPNDNESAKRFFFKLALILLILAIIFVGAWFIFLIYTSFGYLFFAVMFLSFGTLSIFSSLTAIIFRTRAINRDKSKTDIISLNEKESWKQVIRSLTKSILITLLFLVLGFGGIGLFFLYLNVLAVLFIIAAAFVLLISYYWQCKTAIEMKRCIAEYRANSEALPGRLKWVAAFVWARLFFWSVFLLLIPFFIALGIN